MSLSAQLTHQLQQQQQQQSNKERAGPAVQAPQLEAGAMMEGAEARDSVGVTGSRNPK